MTAFGCADSIASGTGASPTGVASSGVATLGLSGAPAAGNEGNAFAFQPTRTGGTAPFTFSISSGTLPPWASLNTSNGTISGNPVDGHNGATNVTVRVQDSLGAPATLPITITINNNLLLQLSGSPGAIGEGDAFSFVPTRANGVDPVGYTISTGALPAWASLNASTGEITGTPSDGQNGTTNLTLRGIDSSTPPAQALLPLSIIVNNTLSIGLAGSPPTGNEGAAFAFTATRTNGTGPFTYSISAGALPSWASLNTSTGEISGTPVDGDNGTTNVTLRVIDSLLAVATLPLSIVINNSAGSDQTGEFGYLYSPGFTLNAGTNVVARPAQSMPGKAADITDVEPVNPFGCYWLQMTQVVSAGNDDPSDGDMMRHFYSKRPAFNANSSDFVAYAASPDSYGYDYDLTTLDIVPGGRTTSPGNGAIGGASTFPLSVTREALWDPVDPDALYYAASSNGDMVWKKWNRATKAVTTSWDFTGRLGAFGAAAEVWPKQEGRCSNDGRYFAFQVKNGSGACLGYFTWDKLTDTILATLVTSNNANWITVSSLGNFCLIGWSNSSGKTLAECAASSLATADGVRAYDLQTLTTFTQLNNRAQHGDVCLDIAGNEVFVTVSDDPIALLPGIPQGRTYYVNCASGAKTLLPIDVYEAAASQAIHFSGTAIQKPGIAFFSTIGGTTVTTKYQNMVGAIELKPSGARVLRIAYHYSNKATAFDGYWAEPHVVANPTGEIVAWATNYNGAKVVMCAALLSYEAVPYYGATGGGTGTGPDLDAQQPYPFYGSNTTAHACTLPSPIPAGTGILVALSMDGATTVTPPLSLSEIRNDQASGSNFNVRWYWKVAAGTEGGAVADFVTSAGERGGIQVWLFEAGSFTGSPEIAVGAQTTTATPDPPNLAPAGGSGNYFVIAAAAGGTSMTTNPSSYPYPSGQSFLGQLAVASTNDASFASCWDKRSGAAFNPAAFTWALSTPSFAYTVALKAN